MTFWNLRADETAPEDGVLDIEGPIDESDWWGDGSVTGSREFRQKLKGLRNVTVHINSPGGDVMAGAEIYSALREHSMNGRGKVTVIITALAASAASVVAMAGDEILISPVAYMMIHNPWTIAMGDSREMRHTAKVLDEIAEGLITAYERRTGKSRDQLQRMLDSETWMSAQTCVDEGFADGIWGGEVRAAAFAGAGTLTRATPESIRELCQRWEKARNEDGQPEFMQKTFNVTEAPETARPDAQDQRPDASAAAEEQKPVQAQNAPEDPENAKKRADIARRMAAIEKAMAVFK